MTGQTISHYRVLEKLGEGGMGAVYKAEDTRLKRSVALKFLPQRVALTDEDRERFLREAQAAAGLDHPNICTIYGIDEAEGRPFLAMAYVEGRSLEKRIEDGPLPLRDALDLARQAAEGLRAAHGKGVVHRDIKSSNLMLTGEDSGRVQVKLLDFGLAQLAGRSKLTQADSVMGTIAYMSPEQTQGGQVDLRTDIWSLGVVLYEMVSGELPFKGHYDQATLYSILNEEPQPLTAVRSKLPVELDWIVDKCLAKEPEERYQSMDDLILDLTTLEKKLSSPRLSIHRTQVTAMQGEQIAPPAPAEADRAAKRWRRLALGLGALAASLVMAVVTLALLGPGDEAPQRAALRFDINLPATLPDGAELRSLQISPDGRRVAFAVSGEGRRLWLRDLSQASAYALDGTDGASDVFWSPDSQSIGYRADGELRLAPVGGGPSSVLCTIPGRFFGGASFSEDGERIVFSSGPPMQVYEVSARGGQPTSLLVEQVGEGRRGFPSNPRLIGEDGLLFSRRTPQGEYVGVIELSEGEPILLTEGSAPFLSKSGYIVYHVGRGNSEVWALPFDDDKMEAEGEPFPVAQGGMLASVSGDGTLVYVADRRSGPMQLLMRSAAGELVETLGPQQSVVRDPAISPDGQRILFAGESDLWIHDRARGTTSRFTNTPQSLELSAVWSPDGRRIAYSETSDGSPPRMIVRNADGPGQPQAAEAGDDPQFALDWGPQGRILARRRGPGRGALVELEPQPDGTFLPQPVLQGEVGVNEARISPNGDFVAFDSRMGEESQVVVRSFPSGEGRWQVTTDGGEAPRWTRDGREIVYRSHGRLMAVDVVQEGDQLRFGAPRELFQHPLLTSGPRRPGYDVSPSGDAVLLAEPVGRPRPPTIRVVLNWLADYER